jgi:hypothetical protein
MINSTLERQARSGDELMHRLIEERDRKKLIDSNVDPSSCSINFAQTNSQTSGTSTNSTTMPNPSAHSMNHFHNRTTTDGLAPTFGIPQQTTASMFKQGYTHTVPIFSMPNLGSISYTPEDNGRTYANTNDNYQAPYSIVAYTDPIPLLDSLAGFLPNHTYHNAMRYNTYGQLENNDFGYRTPPQFPFRPQPIDMMPARATTEPCADPNNLINQLATILRESFDIEPNGRGAYLAKSLPRLL